MQTWGPNPTKGHASIIVSITLPPVTLSKMTDRVRGGKLLVNYGLQRLKHPQLNGLKPFMFNSRPVDECGQQDKLRQPAAL